MINDYITGYVGAIGAIAAPIKRTTEGGSWHVTGNLTRTAMWCGSLGLVDPALAGRGDQHTLREPVPYDAPSPLRDIHMLARALLADPAFVAQSSPGPSWVQ